MLSKLVKSAAVIALAMCSLNANDFNAGAEKDRLAVIKYLETKFADQRKIEIHFSIFNR